MVGDLRHTVGCCKLSLAIVRPGDKGGNKCLNVQTLKKSKLLSDENRKCF